MLSKPSKLPVWHTFHNRSYNCMPLAILACIFIYITVAHAQAKKLIKIFLISLSSNELRCMSLVIDTLLIVEKQTKAQTDDYVCSK